MRDRPATLSRHENCSKRVGMNLRPPHVTGGSGTKIVADARTVTDNDNLIFKEVILFSIKRIINQTARVILIDGRVINILIRNRRKDTLLTFLISLAEKVDNKIFFCINRNREITNLPRLPDFT